MTRKTRAARAADVQRLVEALSSEQPLTITEAGETQAGPASDLQDDAEAHNIVGRYGMCPKCTREQIGRNDRRLVVGREVWSVCERHRVCWRSGFNDYYHGQTGGPVDWEANKATLTGYQATHGVFEPEGVTSDELVEEISAQAESYDRLWEILQGTYTDPALLAWLLATHKELPADLAWLIRQKLAAVA